LFYSPKEVSDIVDASQPAALRAVLFDFDGTLGDSYPAIAASVNHVRRLHGLAPLPVDEVRRHVGRGAEYLLEHTVPGGNAAEDVAAYRAHHPSVLHSGTRLMPGAAEALRALHERGLRLGVCSNKPVDFARDLLGFLGVAAYVDVVLGPEDVARPKPAPDMLQAALQRLGVDKDEALYVGDMTVDVQAARAAGMRVWIVPTGSDEPQAVARAGPDRVLADLFELRRQLTEGP
jgi:phosphoglycolate phosphatase